MLHFRQVQAFALFIGVLATSACADTIATDALAPSSPAQSSGKGSLPDLGTVANDASELKLHALWWKKQHKTEVKVSQTIGVEGGTITVAATGLTLSFPQGAVSRPITITVTADPRYVAYRMEPSGTQFLKEITATQTLQTTSIYGQPLRGQIFAAYIADDRLKLSGSIPALELEPSHTIFSALNPLIPQAHVWFIRHFSRYILASG
ncbi:MAG TPA: hypothetical protein VM166_14350 [Gemmatimonadaceae bacterium]|nr:hypothetical protein [Gemmatimonadaceae bacterium]